MMRRFLILVAAAVLMLTACSRGDSITRKKTLKLRVLSVCLYPGFAPFAEKGDDGTWSGWDVEYLRGFAHEQGLKLLVIEVPQFKNIWMRPGSNECDIAGTGITRTDERVAQTGEAAGWSATYYTVAHGFAVRQGSVLHGIEDLKGQTVLTTKGTTAEVDLQARLQQAGISNTTLEYVDSEESAAARVLDRSAFAFAAGVGTIKTLAKKYPDIKLAWEHCIMQRGGSISSEPFGFVVRSDSKGLLTALNHYIANPANPYPGGRGSGRECPTDM